MGREGRNLNQPGVGGMCSLTLADEASGVSGGSSGMHATFQLIGGRISSSSAHADRERHNRASGREIPVLYSQHSAVNLGSYLHEYSSNYRFAVVAHMYLHSMSQLMCKRLYAL